MSKKNSGWGRKWTIVCFATLAFLLLALGILLYEAGIAVAQAEELSQTVFRLHIVANSDSKEDQDLKILVRDAMIEEMDRILSTEGSMTKEETMAFVQDMIPQMEEIGRQVVKQAGFDYDVSAMVCKRAFPTKEYLDLFLPAWDYDCLYVRIGEAAGQNWWCVLFPKLCFTEGIVGKLDPESEGYLEENLSEDTYDMITVGGSEKPGRVQVRFKIVEVIQGIRAAFRKD